MSALTPLLPLLVVVLTGLIVLVLDLFRSPSQGSAAHLAWLTAIGHGAALVLAWNMWPGVEEVAGAGLWAGALVIDAYTLFFWGALALFSLLAALSSRGFDVANNLDHGEYYAFFSFALAGMMLLVAAADLITLFLALETMALSVYVLVAMKRDSKRSAEAGFKYFINGALASALILYGIALFWGETGSLQMSAAGDAVVQGGGNPMLFLAATLMLAGFCFKVAAVPFHMWTPDACQGAPTSVTAFMDAGVKAASFAALLRLVFVVMLPELFSLAPFSFVDLVIGISVLTMTVGNLVAMHQTQVKRMLAWSSISHAGYLLMGLALVPPLGSGVTDLRFASSAMLFYLVAYGLATLLAFGVLSRLGSGGDEDTSLERLAGLATHRPLLALLLALALLSLAGFPPTAGFFAKFDLFREVVVVSRAKMIPVVVIAVLNVLASVYYYLKPIVAMYMQESTADREEISSPTSTVALAVAALLVLLLGLFPGKLSALADEAAHKVVYRHAKGLRLPGHAPLAPFAEKARKSK